MTMILKNGIQFFVFFFRLLKWQGIKLGLWIGLLGYKCLFVYILIMNIHEPILPDAFPMSSSHHMLLGVNRSNQGIGKRPFPGPCTAFISGPGFRSVSQAPEQLVPDFFGTIPKKLIAGCFEGDPPDLWKSSSEVAWKSLSEFLSTNLIDTEHHQYFYPKRGQERQSICEWVCIWTSLSWWNYRRSSAA